MNLDYIYERISPLVKNEGYKLSRGIFHSNMDAEDFFQELMLKVLTAAEKELNKGIEMEKVIGYCVRVVKNESKIIYRDANRFKRKRLDLVSLDREDVNIINLIICGMEDLNEEVEEDLKKKIKKEIKDILILLKESENQLEGLEILKIIHEKKEFMKVLKSNNYNIFQTLIEMLGVSNKRMERILMNIWKVCSDRNPCKCWDERKELEKDFKRQEVCV